MTVEEAISVLERLAHTESKWPGTEDTLESLDMALSALRAQQEHEINEPLTLDELRQMEGEPVWTVGVSYTQDGTSSKAWTKTGFSSVTLVNIQNGGHTALKQRMGNDC